MELIDAINQKDCKGFGNFFDENFPYLVVFAEKFLNDMEIAADVTQDAFLQLWHHEGSFNSIEQVRCFLYTTAHNLALNQLKHKKIVDLHVQESSLEEGLLDAVLETETYQLVHSAIAQLGEQTQKVILLSLQGYSNQEIADQLGVSINTVRTLKQNAYKKMRGILKNKFFLWPFISFYF